MAVPPAVVIEIFPVVAPEGITNFSEVEEAPEATVTAVPFRVTDAPSRLVPLTVITATPFLPVVGVKEVMVGAGGTTVNDALLIAPAPVVILIAPDSAPVGTTKVSVVPVLVTGLALLLPANRTLSAFRFLPVTVTVLPTRPEVVIESITAAW